MERVYEFKGEVGEKMKRTLIKVCCVLLIAGMLTGCGKKTGNAGLGMKQQAGNESREADNGKAGKASKNEAIPLSEAFNPAYDVLWYSVERWEKGKDAEVRCVFKFVDQGVRVYPVNGEYTLGDFSKMQDNEIIEMLENTVNSKRTEKEAEQRAGFEEKVGILKENVSWGLDNISSEDVFIDAIKYGLVGEDGEDWYTQDMIEAAIQEEIQGYGYEQFYNDLTEIKEVLENWTYPSVKWEEAYPYQIGVYTDSTGNKTERAGFIYSYNENDGKIEWSEFGHCVIANVYALSGENVKLDICDLYSRLHYSMEQWREIDSLQVMQVVRSKPIEERTGAYSLLNPMEESVQVYDSFYNGYELSSGGMGERRCIICRGNQDVVYTFDEVGTEGIEVDPKDWFPTDAR